MFAPALLSLTYTCPTTSEAADALPAANAAAVAASARRPSAEAERASRVSKRMCYSLLRVSDVFRANGRSENFPEPFALLNDS